MLLLNEILSDFKLYAGYSNDELVDVYSRSKYGETPLHWMAKLGDHNAIQILVQEHAKINAKDFSGKTPLHAAILNRQVTAVEKLVLLGADFLVEDNDGKTPLDIAKIDKYKPIFEFLVNGVSWMKSI